MLTPEVNWSLQAHSTALKKKKGFEVHMHHASQESFLCSSVKTPIVRVSLGHIDARLCENKGQETGVTSPVLLYVIHVQPEASESKSSSCLQVGRT